MLYVEIQLNMKQNTRIRTCPTRKTMDGVKWRWNVCNVRWCGNVWGSVCAVTHICSHRSFSASNPAAFSGVWLKSNSWNIGFSALPSLLWCFPHIFFYIVAGLSSREFSLSRVMLPSSLWNTPHWASRCSACGVKLWDPVLRGIITNFYARIFIICSKICLLSFFSLYVCLSFFRGLLLSFRPSVCPSIFNQIGCTHVFLLSHVPLCSSNRLDAKCLIEYRTNMYSFISYWIKCILNCD